MKFLFKTRFTVFDLICWCVFAALINYASPWWLLAIVPGAAVAATGEAHVKRQGE